MVLVLKHWKSRSSPGIKAGGQGRAPSKYYFDGLRINPFTSRRADPIRAALLASLETSRKTEPAWARRGRPAARAHARKAKTADASPAPEAQQKGAAGWSSPVARQAHNLKVVGSNPTPATTSLTPTPHPPTAQRPASQQGCPHAQTQAWRPVRLSGNAARGNSYARSRPCLAGVGMTVPHAPPSQHHRLTRERRGSCP